MCFVDERALDDVAERLYALPTVQAVALGGSRAAGTHRADSDWDLALYYRGGFDPQTLRDVGWPGQVFEIGGWGGGVFNGGAWLEMEGSRVDVHYRDLDSVEHELAEAQAGRFRIEPLLFHLAGIPSYLVVAELALARTLRGSLPRPDYPAALRRPAPQHWWEAAVLTMTYARDTHARGGHVTPCLGLLAQGVAQTAHAVLAGRGEWITNEKQLLTRAGLNHLDDVLAAAIADPKVLRGTAEQALLLCSQAVDSAASDV